MGARRSINRYKTEPFGRDYDDVLKRGKVFHRDRGSFMMLKYGNTWNAFELPAFGKLPEDAIVITKKNGRWVEGSEEGSGNEN